MVRGLLPFVSLAAILPALVSAHGQLRSVTIDNTVYDAPDLYYDGSDRNQNTPVRKAYQASSPSYLLPGDFNNDNKMACEEAGAAPGVAVVKPGSEVNWLWEGATTELRDQGLGPGTPWVHAMGYTATYIGSCNGDCKGVDASQIEWVKIDFDGLNPGNILDNLRNAMANKPEPYRSDGLWGMAKMIENGSKYSSRVPQGLKNGQYIMRSELAAVHNPLADGNPTSGPQLYVACLQIEVRNGGDVQLPKGTKAGSLYDPNGDFARYSVFTSPASFTEPGPAVWNGASASGTSNQNQNQNQDSTGNGNSDNSNQNQNTGNGNGDNSNQNQNTGNGNSDNSNQNQNTGGDNSNQNQNQGNGNSTDGKQCRRRRSNSKRGIAKVARSLRAAHAKRHH